MALGGPFLGCACVEDGITGRNLISRYRAFRISIWTSSEAARFCLNQRFYRSKSFAGVGLNVPLQKNAAASQTICQVVGCNVNRQAMIARGCRNGTPPKKEMESAATLLAGTGYWSTFFDGRLPIGPESLSRGKCVCGLSRTWVNQLYNHALLVRS